MLTLNTELQYKKSQYESLYSMRIKKFLHDSTCRRNQDKSDFVAYIECRNICHSI